MATSSAEVDLTLPAYTSSALGPSDVSAPNPPNSTFESERFMATHMIRVRIIPDAPTRVPAMIRTVLSIINPVADAARPEYEFKSAITTGISAPPIAITSSTPSTAATTTIPQNRYELAGFATRR